MEGPEFLKKKYDLHNALEVERAAKRTEARTGEKFSQKPADRIQNYLDRFKEIIERKEPAKRERGVEALKQVLHDKFVIKPEEIPEGYYENQKRLAREHGHGEIEITEEARRQLAEVIITDQKGSLDNWVDYLSSEDATYPDWLKYYVFRSILNLGEYDKEKKQFTKRSKGTVKPFPDINREALAYVLDAIEKKYQGKIPAETDPEFKKYLDGENFAKLYAFAIDKVTPATESALTDTRGEWVKYRQGRDHLPLVNSLQGHGTGWCTAGESTAKVQLEAGDFYVYYSFDGNGKPNVPRAAIRMQGENIAEVRGIAGEQNLDPYIAPIVETKMKEFPDGAQYEKKSADMKLLTAIENKTKKGEPLSKDDLIFLYEINAPIEGFGYQKDPRIKELRDQRNPKEDAPIVLDCLPREIAWKQEDINQNIKAYIGPLFPDVFQTNLEHIYTSFPEGKIQKYHTEIGGKTKNQLKTELQEKKIYVSDWANQLLESKDFTILKSAETVDLIRLIVKDLGFPNGATTDEIYKKATKLGLELCPAEVGPHLRLSHSGSDWMYIAMRQITDRDGSPKVFSLNRNNAVLRLYGSIAKPSSWWNSYDQFVFLLRKKKL